MEMATTYPTRGEQLVQRRLRRELRGSIWHYVTGQHEAVIEDVTDDEGESGRAATISYVDVTGHAVVLVLMEDEGRWVPLMKGRAGQLVFSGWDPVADGFELSEGMREALARAEG